MMTSSETQSDELQTDFFGVAVMHSEVVSLIGSGCFLLRLTASHGELNLSPDISILTWLTSKNSSECLNLNPVYLEVGILGTCDLVIGINPSLWSSVRSGNSDRDLFCHNSLPVYCVCSEKTTTL